jgi:hypothetical protein
MRYIVLTDDDVRRVLPMSAAVDRIESACGSTRKGLWLRLPASR